MESTQLLAVALTCFALVEGQYGPLQGSSTRRTTTPFPPGFQSDSQLYNSVSNSIAPDSNQISHSYTYTDSTGQHSGSFAASSSGCGGSGSSGGCGPVPSSGFGVLPGSNQKTPAGAVSYADNPWLSGVVAQNSGPGPSPSYPQSSPSVTCNAPGHVCVQTHQCQGGQTSSPGSGNRQCDANAEVCCQYSQQRPLPQPSPGYGPAPRPHQPAPSPTFQPGQHVSSQRPVAQPGPTYQPSPVPHPSPQPSYQPGPSYQPAPVARPSPQPGPTYQPGATYQPSQQPAHRPQPVPQGPNYYPGSASQSGYRPGTNGVPIGGSIYDANAARPAASYATTPAYGPYTGPLNTTPHPGCPAALKCVEEIYCDVMGVMRESPVQLTREEYENRVPLSECQNIETGIIGKCCRDPNYKDPWPDMNNGVFDDGLYHGEHGAHGGHGDHGAGHQQHQVQPQGQFHQQGTSYGSTCGPSATCTPQSQCSGDRQVQPGKQCQVPQDGSTGVCCSKPPFPSFTNNHQVNPSATPATPAQRPTPGQLYYTPKPSYSNNPFLPENQGKFPFPQQPSFQGSVRPTGVSPVNYTPTQPNAITGQNKYDSGKQSTPKPFRPTYTTPQTPVVSTVSHQSGYPQPSPLAPQPGYPQPSLTAHQPQGSSASYPQPSPVPTFPRPSQAPSASYPRPSSPSYQQPSQAPSASYPRPSSTPNYQQPSSANYPQPSYSPSTTPQPSYPRPTGPAASSISHSQPSVPSVSNLPAFPQIATSNSVYSPRPGQSLPSSPQPSTPSYQYSTTPSTYGYSTSPSTNQHGSLPGSNVRQPSYSTSLSSTISPQLESNDITPVPDTGFRQTPTPAPTKGRGPPAGYPFLAPTTEPPKRRPGQPVQPGKDCGVRREVQRPNGPNGLETGFGEFPWQVQVLVSVSQTPLCSGAILSNKVIVTAAHCVDDFRSTEISIMAGDWKLGGDNPDEPKPTQLRQVAAISRHPKYDPVSRFYDMAVLILSEPLQMDEHVDVLCLGDNTPPGQRPGGSNCIVTGWGKPNLQSNTPGSAMHSIPVSFIESSQCEDVFRKTNLGRYFHLNKSFVCAVPNSPNDDLCQVDVGSPIVCQKPNGRYELSGIYSWDVGCHQPVAASNVDKPWVQSVMNKPVEQVKQEEEAEFAKKESLGFNPQNSDLNKPGFSQGYGKK